MFVMNVKAATVPPLLPHQALQLGFSVGSAMPADEAGCAALLLVSSASESPNPTFSLIWWWGPRLHQVSILVGAMPPARFHIRR